MAELPPYFRNYYAGFETDYHAACTHHDQNNIDGARVSTGKIKAFAGFPLFVPAAVRYVARATARFEEPPRAENLTWVVQTFQGQLDADLPTLRQRTLESMIQFFPSAHNNQPAEPHQAELVRLASREVALARLQVCYLRPDPLLPTLQQLLATVIAFQEAPHDVRQLALYNYLHEYRDEIPRYLFDARPFEHDQMSSATLVMAAHYYYLRGDIIRAVALLGPAVVRFYMPAVAVLVRIYAINDRRLQGAQRLDARKYLSTLYRSLAGSPNISPDQRTGFESAAQQWAAAP